MLNGRYADRLEEVCSEITHKTRGDGKTLCVAADLSTEKGLRSVFEACPSLDILVTNSRGPVPAPIDAFLDADLDEALRLHLWAPLKLVQHYLPGMVDRSFGRIVNITSAMVRTPAATMMASSAARSGLTGAMHGTAMSVMRYNVTINQILPMLIDSPRQYNLALQRAQSGKLDFDQVRNEQSRMTAANRFGRPDEVGAACAFLCSQHAGYTTGLEFRVDGGGILGVDSKWEINELRGTSNI